MSGIFGIVSENDCAEEVYYGVDYHSHLGTKCGGMALFDGKGIKYDIKNIFSIPFRPQLSNFLKNNSGNSGIGVISDYEPQPLLVNSHLGNYALVHVGKINNLETLVGEAQKKGAHFAEMSLGNINPVEVIATLINQGRDFVDGIGIMQNTIKGSSSIMLLSPEGIYLARDKYGRTPIVTGRKEGAMAATSETSAFPNLGFRINSYLGSGEIGILTPHSYEQLKKPEDTLQICTFLYIYYGFPASSYERINAEISRENLGKINALKDEEDGLEIDFVAGIPDSGIGSALGYANARRLPYRRPLVKYTPTWPRSFMPQDQTDRDLIAKYKLIPIDELILDARMLFSEDSIVRGTQLQKKIQELFEHGAAKVHMRPSCAPLTYSCSFLNFSRSKSVFDLAARRAMQNIEGKKDFDVSPYLEEGSEKYLEMVEVIREGLGLTSLRFPGFEEMNAAIGLGKEKLCPGCWRDCGDCK